MQSNLYSNTAQFYDLAVDRNPAIAADIEFYKKIIPPQARVLEIGCGTGRIAITLYQHRCLVTGIDLSESMLAEFTKKLRASPDMQNLITLRHADMINFDLDSTFDWVIFPFRVFQALKDNGARKACLQTIQRHMGMKSRAILSLFNPAPDILASWGKKGIIDFDIELPDSKRRLRRIQNQIVHDAKAQIITTEQIYQVYDDQEVLEEYPDHLELGYLYPEQASELFKSSGLFIEQVYGDYSFQPLQQDVKKEQIYILRIAAE